MLDLNLPCVAQTLRIGCVLFTLSIVSNVTGAVASDKTLNFPCGVALWGDCYNSRVEAETWEKVKSHKYGVFEGESTIQAVDKYGVVLFTFYLDYESDKSSNVSKEIRYLRYLTR